MLEDGAVRLRPLTTSDNSAWRDLKDRNQAWLSRWEATVPPGDQSGRVSYRQMIKALRSEAMQARMLPFAVDYSERLDRALALRKADGGAESLGSESPGSDAGSGSEAGSQSAFASSSGSGSGSGSAGPVSSAVLPSQRLPRHLLLRHTDADYRLVGQLTISGIAWGSLRSANVGYWVDELCAGRGVIPTAVALAVDHCFTVCGLHRVEVCIRPENTPSRRVVEKLGFREEGVRRAYLHIDGGWRDHATYALTAEEIPEGLVSRWHAARATPHGGRTA